MNHPKSFKSGDHLTICDSCGAQRYRSQCQYTWDGYLMCTVRNCWYPKHNIHTNPPVINDPQTIYDVRPDQINGTETFVSDAVGHTHTFGNTHVTFVGLHKKFGSVDTPPDYINGETQF